MVTPAIFSMLCDESWGDKATCRYMYNHVLHLHHKALLAPGHPHLEHVHIQDTGIQSGQQGQRLFIEGYSVGKV